LKIKYKCLKSQLRAI